MSVKNNSLRVVLLLDDEFDYTNNKYLYSFIIRILYEGGCKSKTAEELSSEILELTSLEYFPEEIVKCIRENNKDEIFEKEEFYSLNENGVIKAKSERANSDKFTKIIELFLDANKDKYSIKKSSMLDLIYKFIYHKFNENLEEIEAILNNKISEESSYEDFSNEEASIINDFLAFENEEKDRLIYNCISKAVDFCMINSKKETVDFSDYTFYLDTNIIVRLLGINNLYRKESNIRFIEKCVESKIKLKISSFVNKEFDKTCDSQINNIIPIVIKRNTLLSPQAISFGAGQNLKKEFYRIYFDWVVSKNNKKDNFIGFKKYLLKEFEKLKEKYSIEVDNENSFEIKNQEMFENLTQSLMKEKEAEYLEQKKANTDVNSVLLVLERRNKESEKQTFLISTDKKLINWCKTVFTAESSIAEHPSAWLSIILKFKGRANTDDFSAFCKFIKIGLVENDKDLQKKIDINRKIISSNLQEEIQESILCRLNNSFPSYPTSYSSDDIIEYEVEYDRKETEKRVAENVSREKTEEYEKRLASLEEFYKNKEINKNQRFDDLKEEYNNKTSELNQKVEELESKLEESKKNVLNDFDEDFNKRKKGHIIKICVLSLIFVALPIVLYFLLSNCSDNSALFQSIGTCATIIIETIFSIFTFRFDDKKVVKSIIRKKPKYEQYRVDIEKKYFK